MSRSAFLASYGTDLHKRAFVTATSGMLTKQVDHNGAGSLEPRVGQEGEHGG